MIRREIKTVCAFHCCPRWLTVKKASDNAALTKHSPEVRDVPATQGRSEAALLPQLDPTQSLQNEFDFEHWSLGVYEWLGLASLHSPRILKGNGVDAFLSRYRVPDFERTLDFPTTNVISSSWRGLIPNAWVRDLLVQLVYFIPEPPIHRV